jgi:hypothetical protein
MATMETIEERGGHSGPESLLVLKEEILSALSSVRAAKNQEEVLRADQAYKKALDIARRRGYRPHIRAAEGQQIQVEWVPLAKI